MICNIFRKGDTDKEMNPKLQKDEYAEESTTKDRGIETKKVVVSRLDFESLWKENGKKKKKGFEHDIVRSDRITVDETKVKDKV